MKTYIGRFTSNYDSTFEVVVIKRTEKSVTFIHPQTKEKKRAKLDLADPQPLELQDVEWIIITKDNAEEVFEKVKSSGGDYALFAVTDEGYEKLSLNLADIRNKLAEQRQIILSYKEYYEGDE